MKLAIPVRLCFVLLLAFFTLGNGAVNAADKLVLQLPWHHQFQFAGYYMAEDKGYYRDAGLDVEIRDVTQAKNPVAEVLSGQADFGISGSGLLVERSLGKPVVAVSAIFQQAPTVFLSLKQSGIREPADLIGKKVMLSPGFQSLTLIALLHQEKLLDRIERIETSFDFNSLLNERTDVFNAYRTNEPYLLKTQGYQTNMINPEDYGIYFYGDILFTSETFLQNQPKSAEKFRIASLKGWEYALNHPDEAIAVIRSKYLVKKTVPQLQFEAAAIAKVIQADQVEIGRMDRARWAQAAHHLIAIGQIPANFHLESDFLYEPPQGIEWGKLRPWIIGVLAAFAVLFIFLNILFNAYLRIRATRKQLREEIQERKQAEEALRESEEKHRALYENAPLPYQSLDEDGCFLDVNPAWLRTLGYEREEVIGQRYGDFLHPDWQAHFEKSFPAFKKRGYVSDVQFKIRHKDGHYLDISFEGCIGFTPDGKFKQTYCVFQDITARKQVEEALRESEHNFRQLADFTYDWEYWINPAGVYVYLSPSCERVTGHKREEFMADPELLFNIVRPDFAEKVHQHYGDESNKEVPIYSIEFPIITKGGEERWLEHNCNPVYDEQGHFAGRRGNNRDITERKQAEEQRLELEAQLRQKYKLEAVGVMAGGIAHNFNNNLAIMLGNIELSSRKLPAGSAVNDYLNNAKTAIMRSRDLVLQILTYSREGIPIKAPVRLPLVIDETLKLLHSTTPSTIKLEQIISTDSQGVTINADSTQIQESLINLCNNSVHAMDEKGELTLSLETVELQKQDIPAQYECLPGRYAKLSVQDSGSGIAAATLEKIFDPFFTTKEINEGTGMGLSTVQGIVDQHGGLIKVRSTLGQGTTFELYFPVIETPELEIPAAVPELPSGNEKVLFLDDDEMLANVWSRMLSDHGYQVTTETSSTKVLKMFKENPAQFDLVITDQTMPELCGKDLIQELLSIRPDLPTILCTGYSNKINETEAKRLGIKAFCMKPLDLPELVQAMRKVLDGEEIG